MESDSARRTAIVVEGGAMRGIFSAGVLDVFNEHNLSFDLALGCSAGASNLASFLAKQVRRNYDCYTKFMVRPEFINFSRFLRGGSLLDLDWLWDILAKERPLDLEALKRSPTKLLCSLTSTQTGEPLYLSPFDDEPFEVLKGSCAIPLLYRTPIQLGEHTVVDGGVAAPLPIDVAIKQGATHILVVRSRPSDVQKSLDFGVKFGAFVYRKQKALSHAILKSTEVYARSSRLADFPPTSCKIVHLAPKMPLCSSRLTRNLEHLERDYELGKQMGLEAIKTWNERLA